MFISTPPASDVKRCIEAFDSRFAEMDRALWCLSRAATEAILARKRSEVTEVFVWTIKSWWGIQGVRRETKIIAADALLDMDLDQRWLAPETAIDPDGEQFAVELVADFVARMSCQGVPRREWSFASKILHWLMPWKIPVYDSLVKKSLGISANADHKNAYREIVQAEFTLARKLLDEGREWIGNVAPRTPFRALDKYFWWIGGGRCGQARVVTDPWQKVRPLGVSVR